VVVVVVVVVVVEGSEWWEPGWERLWLMCKPPELYCSTG